MCHFVRVQTFEARNNSSCDFGFYLMFVLSTLIVGGFGIALALYLSGNCAKNIVF